MRKQYIGIGSIAAVAVPVVASVSCETGYPVKVKNTVRATVVDQSQPLAGELAKLQGFKINPSQFQFISKMSQGESISIPTYKQLAKITTLDGIHTVPNYTTGYGLNAPLNAEIVEVVIKTHIKDEKDFTGRNKGIVVTVHIRSHDKQHMASKDITLSVDRSSVVITNSRNSDPVFIPPRFRRAE